MKYAFALCLALMATTAFAGTTPHTGDDPAPTPGPAMDAANNATGGAPGAAQAPQDPCSRNPTMHQTIPGVGDIDTVRCEISMLQLAVAHAAIQSAVDATQAKMREADQAALATAAQAALAAARGEIAGLKSEIERLKNAAPKGDPK